MIITHNYTVLECGGKSFTLQPGDKYTIEMIAKGLGLHKQEKETNVKRKADIKKVQKSEK